MRLPFGLRWWEFAPEAVLAVGLGLFAATETSAATSALRSGRAIVLMAVVAVGWLALRFVLVRYTRWPAVRVAIFAVAGLGILRVVVFPAYSNTTVVEALPVATVITTTTLPATATTTTTTTVAATTTSTQPSPTPTPSPAITPEPATTVPPTTTAPVEPVAFRSGSINGIDHRASGTAVLYRQPDGTHTVGLENIDIQPGPDYDVFVVPGANREDKSGGTRLDDLRGNKGTQFYAVPVNVDIGQGDWTVLVWCQTFDVPVAGATPV